MSQGIKWNNLGQDIEWVDTGDLAPLLPFLAAIDMIL